MRIIKQAPLGGGKLWIEESLGKYTLIHANHKINYVKKIRSTNNYEKAIKWFNNFRKGTPKNRW